MEKNREEGGANEAILILHDIRSELNVGSLFRTADAAGISKVYVTGYSPAPLDRFERPSKGIAKAALGAENLPWEKRSDLPPLIAELRKSGFRIIAIEQSADSVDYRKVRLEESDKVAFMLGNEVEGIAPEMLKLADIVAEIPMHGEKESLNVSVAGGIALFRMLGR